MYKTGETLWRAALVFMGIMFGNWAGDQATIRDCATEGHAVMLGGGIVKCEVIKK